MAEFDTCAYEPKLLGESILLAGLSRMFAAFIIPAYSFYPGKSNGAIQSMLRRHRIVDYPAPRENIIIF